MTGDAQAEAERIVSDYALRVQGEVEPDSVGWDDRYLSGAAEAYERLVAALAAAREVYDSRRMLGTEWGEYKVEVDRFAWERLGDALSALRARAGEET